MSSFKFQEGATSDDTLKMLLETLNWLMGKLDSKNVRRLFTEECDIQSADGETRIVGPLLEMRDKQGSPVLRLKMGYDADSTDFVFQLMNASGDITVSLDSNGDLTVERGTFKGSITIGSGNNVIKANSTDGLWVGHADFVSAPFKVTLAGGVTATNITIVGGTIKTAEDGNDRIEFDGSGLTSYNESNAKEGFAIETGNFGYSRALLYAGGLVMGGLEYNTLGVMGLFTDSGVDLYISPASGYTTKFQGKNCFDLNSTIGFFGSTPIAQQLVSAPATITATGTADTTYSANEVTLINALKADVTNLRSTLNSLVAALKAYGLV